MPIVKFIKKHVDHPRLFSITKDQVITKATSLFQWQGICILCQASTDSGFDLCASCESELPYLEQACIQCALPLPDENDAVYCGHCLQSPLTPYRVFSPFYYDRPINRMITRLKFSHQLAAAKVLGQLIAKKMQVVYHTKTFPDVLIPVPLHKKRLQERGFNQAVELAKPISRLLSIPIIYNDCIRLRHTKPQTSLSAKERVGNLKNAFTVQKSANYEYVGLIDDVMTTGQTAFALSKALLKAGVKRIDIWCCARASLHN